MDATLDPLRLENQLCFPLYAASRKIVNLYTPYFKPLGITYTQYIVLMVLWAQDGVSVRELAASARRRTSASRAFISPRPGARCTKHVSRSPCISAAASARSPSRTPKRSMNCSIGFWTRSRSA